MIAQAVGNLWGSEMVVMRVSYERFSLGTRDARVVLLRMLELRLGPAGLYGELFSEDDSDDGSEDACLLEFHSRERQREDEWDGLYNVLMLAAWRNDRRQDDEYEWDNVER